MLGVSFMIVYTIVSPVMGWLGDRYNRKLLLAGGVGLWSLATVGTAFSGDFYHMFFWRALLGIGEASYGVIAPALIADLFPVKRAGPGDGGLLPGACRSGRRLGYMLGGTIAERWAGGRSSSWSVCPGLLAAAAGLFMSDPGRGASEGGRAPGQDRPARPGTIISTCSGPRPSCSTPRAWRPSPSRPVPTRPGARRSISAFTACRRNEAGNADRPLAGRSRA